MLDHIRDRSIDVDPVLPLELGPHAPKLNTDLDQHQLPKTPLKKLT